MIFEISFSILSGFIWAYGIYIALKLLIENTEYSSKTDWVLALFFLPFIGLLAYYLTGKNLDRNSKSYKRKLENIKISKNKSLNKITTNQKNYLKFIQDYEYDSFQPKIINLLEKNFDSLITIQNEVNIFTSGKDKFDNLKTDLSSAKFFIHMEYFIWRDDDLTNEIKDILLEKLDEGVEIRIIIDYLGSFFTRPNYFNELKKKGAQVKYFSPIQYFKLHRINYRNHRKIVVIDGNIGYTGGMNMGEEYISGGKKYDSWKDLHLKIKGESVRVLQTEFSATWYFITKNHLNHRKYHPEISEKKVPVPIQIITSEPRTQSGSIELMYFSLINFAETSFYIQTPYFIPSESLFMALKNLSLSGVDVRIMMTGIPDKKIPFYAAQSYFKELVDAGVKIYHYKKGFLHSKFSVIDGKITSVGTSNFDIRSFRLNYELNLIIYEDDTSAKFNDIFLKDISYCTKIDKDFMNNLDKVKKLRNSLSKILSPVL